MADKCTISSSHGLLLNNIINVINSDKFNNKPEKRNTLWERPGCCEMNKISPEKDSSPTRGLHEHINNITVIQMYLLPIFDFIRNPPVSVYHLLVKR